MLPAHGYPKLKEYPHFFGHYGTAWQNQQREFPAFPGAILMTTNCIQKPLEYYKANIFTAGPVGWPGVAHISNRDFSPVIKKALEMPGFQADKEGKYVTVGFARNAVLSVADKIIGAVKKGHIKRFTEGEFWLPAENLLNEGVVTVATDNAARLGCIFH
jgi:hydroxylamine reductase